jgi:catechol 2,3-dioxygenase-like lactoylglutathione lyase family enzyme
MLTLGVTVIGVTDMGRAVAFWTQALGFAVSHGGPDSGWTELGPPGAARPRLALQHSDEQAEAHPRLHLDLYADSAQEQAAEAKRLISLGAENVDWDMYPPDPDFVVLADPDGNRFCIVNLSAGHPPTP